MKNQSIQFTDFITEELKNKRDERYLTNKKMLDSINTLNYLDYKTSKVIDGEFTTQEIEEIKATRKELRKTVNDCKDKLLIVEKELKVLEDNARAEYEKALQEEYEQFMSEIGIIE